MSKLRSASEIKKTMTMTMTKTKTKIPSEVKIVAGIECFSGVMYLVNFLGLLSIDSLLLLALCILSFGIAYGLWHLQKWAWFLSLSLSLLGAVGGIVVLVFMGISEYSLVGIVPKIILDMLVIFILITKDVRKVFNIHYPHTSTKI